MDKGIVCITGSQSCALMRMARIGRSLSAVHFYNGAAVPFDYRIHTVGDLHAEALLDMLHVDRQHPLEILVPSAKFRRDSAMIRSRVLSIPLPDGAFLELKPGADPAKRISLPQSIRILIESPPLALLQGARTIQRLISCQGGNRLNGILRLMEFADECCGWYSRDPKNPRSGSISYDQPHKCTRLTTPETMRAFVEEISNVDGVRLARIAARHAIDEAGSPMEAYINHALALPPRFGGLSMRKPLANQQLRVDEATHAKLKHHSLRPDLQWPEQHTLAEYLGDKNHAGRPARIEDKDRMQDYMTASFAAFPLMYDDVRNATSLGQTAEMIARELMRRGAKEELYNVRKLLRDEEFRIRQRILVGALLPPITHYEDA